jgi:hypothetical protein
MILEAVRRNGAHKAIAIYREAFGKAERRAAVAEQLAEACFFPKRKTAPRPTPKGDNEPQEASIRPPKRQESKRTADVGSSSVFKLSSSLQGFLESFDIVLFARV